MPILVWYNNEQFKRNEDKKTGLEQKKRSEERKMDAKKYTRKIPRKVSSRDEHAKGQRENTEGKIRQ